MMKRRPNRPGLTHGRRRPLLLAGGLALIGGVAIAGPSGVLAWAEADSLHEQRIAQLEVIKAEKEALAHRVALLDSEGADPDLVSELIRKNLNVVHPDEVIVILEE